MWARELLALSLFVAVQCIVTREVKFEEATGHRRHRATKLQISVDHVARNTITPAFANVLLVVHCERHSSTCEERQPLFDGYKDYFGGVKYLTKHDCRDDESGLDMDKHLCLMDLLDEEGKNYEGMLYTHFDALLAPCRLAKVFDKNALGWFSSPGDNTVKTGKVSLFGGSKSQLVRGRITDDTIFGVEWNSKTASGFDAAIQEIRKIDSKLGDLNSSKVYTSENDLFYLPRAAFKLWMDLVDEFAYNKVWHEISGPTSRKILEEKFDFPSVNYGCIGGCCGNLQPYHLQEPGFRCGHRFDLREEYIRDDFKALLANKTGC